MSGKRGNTTECGVTRCHGEDVQHIVVNGMVLTPRVERYRTNLGWVAREIDGKPVAERDSFGNVVYATPGGGRFYA